MNDAYELCQHVQRYRAKNGYAPSFRELPCSAAFIEALVSNGVIELLPLHEGGPPIGVVLTAKGQRMADKRTIGGRSG